MMLGDTIPLGEVRLEVTSAPVASPWTYAAAGDTVMRWWFQTMVSCRVAGGGAGGADAVAEISVARRWAFSPTTLAAATWVPARRELFVPLEDAGGAVAGAMHGAAMLVREPCWATLSVAGAAMCVEQIPPMDAMESVLDDLDAPCYAPSAGSAAEAVSAGSTEVSTPGGFHAAHCDAVVRDTPVVSKTLSFLRCKALL